MTHQHQRKCWAVTVLVGPLLWALLMAGMSVGCSGDEVVYEGLHLWITSEEPTPHVPIDRIVITVRDVDDDGSVLLFEELSEQDHVREILLGEQYNIYDAPYKAKFVSGEIIGGVVRMALTGFHGDQTISSWTGNVSLDENYKREVVLQLISQSTCTEDADCVAPRSCQIGICEPDSECIFPLKEDYCLIDGTCYLTGSGSVNDLCEVCDTAQSNMELVAVTCPQDMVCQSEKGCVPVGNTCVDLDCDDEDPCTLDTCQDNTCVNAAIENCCTEVADCIPTECQTLIVCDANNTCVYESTCCLSDDECDDGNVCTMNSCEEKDCAFAPIADCCNHAEDCDDASLCTLDDCVDNACHFANIENCCIKAGDCDDATNCSDDTCVNNQCVNDSTNCCGNVSDCPSPQACEQVTCSPAGDCKYQTQSVCTPGTTQNQFCGKCGTQTQACTDQCDWGLFGACQGQGPCSSGQTQECGLGGTQSCTEACTWGACEGEGDCANGATKTCGDCGQSVCANNAWGPCKSQGKCSTGQTLLCGQYGSQTCQANCQ